MKEIRKKAVLQAGLMVSIFIFCLICFFHYSPLHQEKQYLTTETTTAKIKPLFLTLANITRMLEDPVAGGLVLSTFFDNSSSSSSCVTNTQSRFSQEPSFCSSSSSYYSQSQSPFDLTCVHDQPIISSFISFPSVTISTKK